MTFLMNHSKNLFVLLTKVSLEEFKNSLTAADKVDRQDGTSRFYYYKRSTLPENTDFDQLKCNFEQGKLKIEAPIRTDFKSMRNIPINYKGQQPQLQQQQQQQIGSR